jgi:hypothetical protein
VFGDESMSHTWVFEWKMSYSLRPEKVRQVKSKVKSMLISFDIKQTVCREFVIADRTNETTRKLHPKLWREGTGCYITTAHHLTLSLSPGKF